MPDNKKEYINDHTVEGVQKTHNYDQIDEINLQYTENQKELEYQMKMKSDAERQLAVKKEGQALSLYGNKLAQYVIEHTKDISVRPDLSIEKPKGQVSYNKAEIEQKPIEKNQVKKVEQRLEEEAEIALFEMEKTIESDDKLNEIDAKLDKWLEKMSQPQYDASYELVPLPSKGKQYGFRDKHIKMAFMNGSDENILTNPNIIKSGRFLEVLMSRKILSDIKYDELIPADRDALMVWLRGTAYGDSYPIEIEDPKDGSLFEVVIDLSELPVKELELDVNKHGNFEYTTEMGNVIEFKFLTVGKNADLEQMILDKYEIEGELYSDYMTDLMVELIQAINNDTSKESIRKFVNNASIKELRGFRKFLAENDFGVDFKLNVTTPGGESITVPFPINREFFWSEL